GAHAIRGRRREEEHTRSVERFDRRAHRRSRTRRRSSVLETGVVRLLRREYHIGPTSLTCRTWRTRLTHLTHPTYLTHLARLAHLARLTVRRRWTSRLRDARRQLTQRRDVVHDPERSPHRRDDEIAVVHLDVGDGRRREILLQRLPVFTLIERDVRAFERAGVQQALLLGILAYD